MARWLLTVWTSLAAVTCFILGVWITVHPFGSIAAGIGFMLLGSGLGFGIGIYWGQEYRARPPLQNPPVERSSRQRSSQAGRPAARSRSRVVSGQ